MKEETKKIVASFEAENRALWGDKFFILKNDNKIVVMTEGLVKRLITLTHGADDLEITSLDHDESVGEWFRVKKDTFTHIHHYHRDKKESERLLQNLPSKEMMTVEEENGQTVTKNELMAGELFRGVVLGEWIAAVVYHDFVEIAPKVIGWVKLDDRIEKAGEKEFYRPEKLISLDQITSALIDLPYHLGGKSVKTGFDCSSMIQWIVFYSRGLWMPKTSKWQALVGQVVSQNEMQKGDLIFFEEAPDWTIEHVGVLLDEGQMLHAFSDKRKIVVETPDIILESRPGTIRLSKCERVLDKKVT